MPYLQRASRGRSEGKIIRYNDHPTIIPIRIEKLPSIFPPLILKKLTKMTIKIENKLTGRSIVPLSVILNIPLKKIKMS